METITIGQLARAAGVNVQTIRYYERRALVTPVSRRDSGYREFDSGDVLRIRFIKSAQGLGFTLEEISELLELRVAHTDACEAVKARGEAKIREIAAKVAGLQRIRRALTGLVQACDDRSPTTECPILEAIWETKP